MNYNIFKKKSIKNINKNTQKNTKKNINNNIVLSLKNTSRLFDIEKFIKNEESLLLNQYINILIENKLIKINNLDCFVGKNAYQHIFNNLNDCIINCIKFKYDVFVIYNNVVYYRSNTIKECIINIHKPTFDINYNSNLYILLPENFNSHHINIEERLKIYTNGIYDNVNIYNNLTYNRNILTNKLNSINNTEWLYQHHSNLLKFLNESILDNNVANIKLILIVSSFDK